VNGTPVESWDEFAAAYATAPGGGPVQLELKRSEGNAPPPVPGEEPMEMPMVKRTATAPALGSVDALGVVPATVLVSTVTPGSAADQGGLAAGDLIVSVDGGPVGSFGSFAEIVRTSGGRPLALTFARDGEIHSVSIAPRLEEYDSGLGVSEPRYLVGITAEVASLTGALEIDRERNPLVSVPRAVAMTAQMTHGFIVGLEKLVTGELSRKQLAGPIGIAKIAGRAYKRGWENFLAILVFISINLGVLNLLPIPVLDGGQAVIYALEGVRRGPLSLRTREIVQQLGLAVLLLLIGLAFWNDLDVPQQWSRLVHWLSNAWIRCCWPSRRPRQRRASLCGAVTRCSPSAPPIRGTRPRRRSCPRSTRCSPTRVSRSLRWRPSRCRSARARSPGCASAWRR
jgi:hypothetical protein